LSASQNALAASWHALTLSGPPAATVLRDTLATAAARVATSITLSTVALSSFGLVHLPWPPCGGLHCLYCPLPEQAQSPSQHVGPDQATPPHCWYASAHWGAGDGGEGDGLGAGGGGGVSPIRKSRQLMNVSGGEVQAWLTHPGW
jgi:hypothetical protein